MSLAVLYNAPCVCAMLIAVGRSGQSLSGAPGLAAVTLYVGNLCSGKVTRN